jgi:hypothetical protein
MRIFSFLSLIATVFFCCDCKSQTQKADKKLLPYTILVYGLPNFERQNAEGVIAKKYGIRFYAVAGCVVTRGLEDSVEKENKPAYTAIEKKYGKDFWKKFNREVDEEFVKEENVKEILGKQQYINSKQRELEKEGNGLSYIMNPKGSGIYDIIAYGWGKVKEENKLVIYYRLLVYTDDRSVKMINNKIESFEQIQLFQDFYR